MCQNKRVCTQVSGGISLVLIVVALATPWYFFGYSLDIASESCTIVTLMGWRKAYCSTDCSAVECSSSSWRDAPMLKDQASVFDTAGAFMGLALVFTLAAFAMSIYRGRITNPLVPQPPNVTPELKRKVRLAVVGTSLAGVICVWIAIISFMVGVPKNWPSSVCDNTYSSEPCDSFIGSNENFSWGAAGWFVALICLAPMKVLLILSIKPFVNPGYMNVGQQPVAQQQYYAPQQQQYQQQQYNQYAAQPQQSNYAAPVMQQQNPYAQPAPQPTKADAPPAKA